jgi:chromosome partitioning protein
MNIAMINNKGGTGKTTTCVNVAASLASGGFRVLLVDLDAQASASLSMGIPYHALTPSVADILFDAFPAGKAMRHSPITGLDLLTGGMALASTDLMLADIPGRENKLRDALHDIRRSYDFMFFDCPPSLSMLSINALVASDAYIIPVTAEYLALEGLISMMQAMEEVKKGMDINPPLLGIAFTMVIPGLKSARQIIGLVREEYGEMTFKTEINRNVKLTEAPSFGKSIFQHASRSTGARDYAALAAEIRGRCGAHKEQRRGGGANK